MRLDAIVAVGIMNREEKEYLKIVHNIHREHHIQTRLFSLTPIAVSFELFNGHCEICKTVLHSRPMYIVKYPHLETKQINYWCTYCASLHEKYIIALIITKN